MTNYLKSTMTAAATPKSASFGAVLIPFDELIVCGKVFLATLS